MRLQRRLNAAGIEFPTVSYSSLAEDAGFELLLTTDKNIQYQQNLKGRQIAIIVLRNSTWRVVRKYLDRITAAANEATPGSFAEVDIPFE